MWPLAAMGLACLFSGVGTAGWYGVFLAEIARQAPAAGVGLATGGALFFIYSAVFVGPLTFSTIVAITGSYTPAFWLGAAVSLVATINFLRIPTPGSR